MRTRERIRKFKKRERKNVKNFLSIFNSPRIFYFFSSPSRSRCNRGGSNNAGKYGFNFQPSWNNAASSAVLLFYDIASVR